MKDLSLALERESIILEMRKAFDKTEEIVERDSKELDQFWIFAPSDAHPDGRYPNDAEIRRHNGKFLVCRKDGGLYIDSYIASSTREDSRFGRASSFIVIENANPVIKWMNLPNV